MVSDKKIKKEVIEKKYRRCLPGDAILAWDGLQISNNIILVVFIYFETLSIFTALSF